MTEKFIPMGFQYYRAPTPARSEWARDLANIATDGYNTVKYWIQWRWNEPRRGEYDFSDIDELMTLAEKNGLKVVLNVILEVSPVWLTKQYPDSVMISSRGERVSGYASECRQIGGAPGPCYHHEASNRLKETFLTECVKRYGNHPALLLWDVWNEPELTEGIYREPKAETLLCYCENSVREFGRWLEQKYGKIEALNRVWGRRYMGFDEVEPPKQHGTTGDMIDWRLFFCDTITQEFAKRVEIVKRYDKSHPVMCHTVPIPLFNSITCCSDDFSIAQYGDIIGNSVGSNPMVADLLKSVANGKDIINAEIHACYGRSLNGFRMPDVTDMLRHVFIPLVHGSKGFLYWQYRPELLGNEAPAWGNTALDGGNTPWNELAKKMHMLLGEYRKQVAAYVPPEKEIAIYLDKANEIYSWAASRDTKLFTSSVIGAYDLFYRNNYAVDFIDGKGVLDGKLFDYKAVYFPGVFLFDEEKKEKLVAYVKAGGTAIIEALFACENEKTGRHCTNIPGCGVAELLNKRIEKIYSSAMIENGYDGKVFSENGGECVEMFDGNRALCGGKYLLTYTGETGKPLASFSQNRVAAAEYTLGKGRIVDIATLFAYGYELSQNENNLSWIRKVVGEPRSEFSALPFGVRGDGVFADGEGFVVLDNPTDSEKRFVLPYAEIGEIIGDCRVSEGMFVLEKKKTALIKIKKR